MDPSELAVLFLSVTERTGHDMDPASVTQITEFLLRSNARIDYQDKLMTATNQAVQSLVTQVTALTTQVQQLTSGAMSSLPTPSAPELVSHSSEPQLPPPAFYLGEPQLC